MVYMIYLLIQNRHNVLILSPFHKVCHKQYIQTVFAVVLESGSSRALGLKRRKTHVQADHRRSGDLSHAQP